MFSHESIPLIIIFTIMLLGVLAAVLHPVHALVTWLRRRNEGSSRQHAQRKIRVE
ncbi:MULTISPECIES: hypothetical protein [unclassified Pseudomonas]|uniref:hypothetical protein n=1 Tax=unclassified Pseudomonas TaxID=196821 RepID=UPI00087F7355|nr:MULTISPECIES: hypothetical protein [unclassified Pseudomonas]SCY85639.1 hypothetical protein SAMN03159391_03422 [Pseudomonas sp. NFACC37-1]SFO48595.1 hypothetical protein SAMN03159304_03576 [Pseudomonas sp. NFACC24-1]